MFGVTDAESAIARRTRISRERERPAIGERVFDEVLRIDLSRG
jgi:hypothetical protein